MKTKTKRILSVLCALVLCVTLLPGSMSARAAENEGQTVQETAVANETSENGIEKNTSNIETNDFDTDYTLSVGEELTLTGSESVADYSWNIGGDEGCIEIVESDESTVTIKAIAAGEATLRHKYTAAGAYLPSFEICTIVVTDETTTVSDLTFGAQVAAMPYSEDGTQAQSTELTFVLTYHGTEAPGKNQEDEKFAPVNYTATFSSANQTVSLTPAEDDGNKQLLPGFYKLDDANEESVVWDDASTEAVYYEVTENGATYIVNSSGTRLENGSTTITVQAKLYQLDYRTGSSAGDVEGTVPETESYQYNQLAEVAESELSREGYTFINWKNMMGDTFYEPGDSIQIKENLTLFANWSDGTETPEEPVPEVKIFYVDDNAAAGGDGSEERPYSDIQTAINAINDKDDKEDWTVIVESGTYGRFVVLSGLHGLTVKAAEGAEVTINTLDPDAETLAGVTFGRGTPDLGGIQLWAANDVTLEGLTIKVVNNVEGNKNEAGQTHHMTAAISNHSESKEQADNFTIRNCTFYGTNDMSAQGNGNVAVSIGAFSSFTIEGCTFTGFMEAIRGQSDNANVTTVKIDNNQFINCSFAIHEYAGNSVVGEPEGTYSFTNNTVKGTSDLYNKAYFEDLYVDSDKKDSNGYTITISGNTFENAIAGLVNLEDNGGTTDAVLSNNTMNANSFVVTGSKVFGQIEMHANYEAPEGAKGYWSWTGKEDMVGGGNPDDAAERVQAAIEEANANGSTTLRFGVDDPDDFLLTFTWFKDAVYWVTDEGTTPEEPGESTVNIDKTATDLTENDQTDVTLTIGAKQGQTVSDVVFVLDKSVSVDIRESAIEMLEELLTRAGENRIKVGVVIFNKSVYEELPLTELNSDTFAEIQDAMLTETSSGTNVYAGLMAGKAMLDADDTVNDAAKHLVLVTDGVTYLWGDGKAEDGSDIYTIYSEQSGNMEESINAGNDMMEAHHSNLDEYFAEFQNIAEWLAKYESQYAADIRDYAHVYGEGQYQPDVKGEGTDSTYENAGFAEGNYIPGEALEGHANANDAAVYMAVTAWKSLAGSGYHLYAYAEQDYATAYPWGPDWVESLSTLGGIAISGAVPDDKTGMFDAVESSIIYAIQSGTVTDIIGNEFNLVGVDTIGLTVGGKVLEGTVEGNKVTFDGGNYIVTYYPNGVNQDSREQLIWEINVPVENANGLQLTYTLQLVNKETAPGIYNPPTNEEAYIEYTPTEGEGGKEYFPVPEVKYEVKEDPTEPSTDPTEPSTEVPTEPSTQAPTQPSNPGSGSGSGSDSGSSQLQTPSASSNTSTGDNAPVGPLFAAALIAAAAIALVVVKKKGILDR